MMFFFFCVLCVVVLFAMCVLPVLFYRWFGLGIVEVLLFGVSCAMCGACLVSVCASSYCLVVVCLSCV